jgi:glutathione peroxidase
MRKFVILLLLLVFYAMPAKNFFDLSAVNIYGDTLNFEEFSGKKILVVNTASECGYTFQYGSLQVLYEKYGGDDFEIIGFPANNFGNQEPGSDEDIEEFCKENYGVTFTMMSKISVKGADMHPVYKWLTQESENGVMSSQVQWNFQKYLINPDGTLHGYYLSNINPMSQEIQEWITDPTNVETVNKEVNVYPVPATSSINFRNINHYTNYQIIDINGNTVVEGKTEVQTSIPTHDLSSGTYFIVFSNQSQIFSKRIIINK